MNTHFFLGVLSHTTVGKIADKNMLQKSCKYNVFTSSRCTWKYSSVWTLHILVGKEKVQELDKRETSSCYSLSSYFALFFFQAWLPYMISLHDIYFFTCLLPEWLNNSNNPLLECKGQGLVYFIHCYGPITENSVWHRRSSQHVVGEYLSV